MPLATSFKSWFVSLFASFAILLATATAGHAEGATTGDVNDLRLFAPGKLTVATGDVVYPPWMLDDNPAGGKGFENELIYALAAEMGFKKEDVVWVRETYDQSIAPGKKNYDFAIQQISVTEDRRAIVTFSQVYYYSDRTVVALPGNAAENATNFDELRKLRWGAVVGTTDLQYMEQVMGITNAAVYDDQIGVFQALQAKQIDGTVVEFPTALYVTTAQVPEARIMALLPSSDKVGRDGHGLLFQKDNPLAPWVDDALGKVMARGVVDELVKKYLVGDLKPRVITN